jgi:hypothetical protein
MKSIFTKLMTRQHRAPFLATAILWKLSDRSFSDSMSAGASEVQAVLVAFT